MADEIKNQAAENEAPEPLRATQQAVLQNKVATARSKPSFH